MTTLDTVIVLGMGLVALLVALLLLAQIVPNPFRTRVRVPLEPSHPRWIREQIGSQYGRARALYRRAWWVERAGLHGLAHKQRHDARLAVRMAVKMQRGLDSGAYLLGTRQYPHVEDQCGCARYCAPARVKVPGPDETGGK